MNCYKCKARIRQGSNFCSNCGLRVSLSKPPVSFKATDVATKDLNSEKISHKSNEGYIEKKTLKLIKAKAKELDFPEKDCTKSICNIALPVFKDLKGRDIQINITFSEFEDLIEKEGISFRDGLWKKDFEGICALCSLEDTPDLVYHCINGEKTDKFCCELHGSLAKKPEMSGIYNEFVFPEWWEKADLETWKENMKKSEETRMARTLEYYKTAMMEKCYCCACDREIEYLEHYRNDGFCTSCRDKKEISDNEKLWQREISKYKVGSIFKIKLIEGLKIGNLDSGKLYKLTRKKGKRVYLGKVDENKKVIKGEGDWYLGLPSCFEYQER